MGDKQRLDDGRGMFPRDARKGDERLCQIDACSDPALDTPTLPYCLISGNRRLTCVRPAILLAGRGTAAVSA